MKTFFFVFLLCYAFTVKSQIWHPVGGNDQNQIVGQCVRTVAVAPDGDIYIAGAFSYPIQNICKWNGARWETLGSGLDGYVSEIKFGPDGDLYVCGRFCAVDDRSICNLARWDGYAWNKVIPDNLTRVVRSFAFGNAGNIFLGGDFYTIHSGLVKWDGNTLTSLGETGIVGGTITLVSDHNGNIYAGGDFLKIGGLNFKHIAKWNGFAWSSLGNGIAGPVHCIEVVGDSLVVGGKFNMAGNAFVNNVALWNGAQWSSMGNGNGLDDEVKTLYRTSDGELWAGGNFLHSGVDPVQRIARFNGIQWMPVFSGADSTVSAIKSDNAGNLLIGGYFEQIGDDKLSRRFAVWDGISIAHHGAGININSVLDALAIDPDDHIYIGGALLSAEAADAGNNNIAKWDGSAWTVPGGGIDGFVKTLEFKEDGDLYAGGEFSQAGNFPAANIARWNGNEWSALGDSPDGPVLAIAFDTAGLVYAGGYFEHCGSTLTKNIARWDGNSWEPLGEGINQAVQALATDASGNVYAAGNFTVAGTTAIHSLARWDGENWSSVGELPNDLVRCLKTDVNGNLYAGGDFTKMGNLNCKRIARWTGSAWEPLGNGLPGNVYAIETNSDGTLYASYAISKDSLLTRAAKWDGISWTPLGLDQFNRFAYELSLDSQGKLYAAGTFSNPFAHLMYWGDCVQTLSAIVEVPNVILPPCKTDSLALSLEVCGGSAPFNYLWSTGETTDSIFVSPLTTQNYCVTVTDANGATVGECGEVKAAVFNCTGGFTAWFVDSVGQDYIALHWIQNPDTSKYLSLLCYIVTNNLGVSLDTILNHQETNFIIHNLPCGSQLELQLQNFCLCGGAVYSGTFGIKYVTTDNCTTSIYNLDEEGTSLVLSPNPVEDILQVRSTNGTKSGLLDIIDAQGRVMQTILLSDATSIDIPTEKLSSGIYVVVFKTETRTVVNKFIKM